MMVVGRLVTLATLAHIIFKIGRSGLGKSTMVNTLFATHLVDSKGMASKSTTEIATVTNSKFQDGRSNS